MIPYDMSENAEIRVQPTNRHTYLGNNQIIRETVIYRENRPVQARTKIIQGRNLRSNQGKGEKGNISKYLFD